MNPLPRGHGLLFDVVATTRTMVSAALALSCYTEQLRSTLHSANVTAAHALTLCAPSW